MSLNLHIIRLAAKMVLKDITILLDTKHILSIESEITYITSNQTAANNERTTILKLQGLRGRSSYT